MENKYQKILEKIQDVLREEDLMSLVKVGAPGDEYNNEALMIFERTNKYDSVDIIQDKLWEVFYQQFCFGTAYKMIDGELKEIGKHATPKEDADKQIGSRNKYRTASEKIKKIWES